MDYVNQMQKSGAFNTTPNSNPRPFNPNPSQMQSPMGKATESDELKGKIGEMQETLALQKQKFDRTIQIMQNRIDVLEKEVLNIKTEFEKISEKVHKVRDREVVEESREALFNRKDRAPVDKPIDRNNVAPSAVQIDNIFNMSGKRF